jgi:glycosyltransferase involved in cell wall biosynthesis
MDAMERVYSELRRHVGGLIDGRELGYSYPVALRKIPTATYVSQGLYAINAWMKRRQDSIIHINNQRLGIVLHLNDFSPSIIFCHDIIEHVMSEYWGGPAYRMFIRSYLTGTLKADVVLTPSKWTAGEIRKHFPAASTRLEPIHDAVDHKLFRPLDRRLFLKRFGLPEDRKYLLYVGSEQPRKNFPAVVRAFIGARKEFPGLTLLKIGRADEIEGYPVHKQIQEELAAAGLSSQALFFENMPDEMMPAAYSAADAFLFPSLYEGFGLPVLEAMACGTPVVASNTTAIPEVAGDGAILVPPTDPNAILEATLRVLRDDELRADLSARGRRRAELFSWDKSAMQLLEIYRQLDPRHD